MGVSDRTLRVTRCAHLVTLRHFDTKVPTTDENGPLIPCERRLANIKFPENQEVTFGARFEYRDYDRPYGHILVTLHGFD